MMRIAFLTFFAFTSFFSSLAVAGPGHDHGGGAETAHETQSKPRFASTGFDVELVGSADGDTLTLYLDESASNAPIAKAAIEVSGPGIEPTKATETAPGTYEVTGDWVHEPGSKALLFQVTYGKSADLLNAVLVVPAEEEATAPAVLKLDDLVEHNIVWGLLAAAMVFGFVMAFAFRFMTSRNAPHFREDVAREDDNDPESDATVTLEAHRTRRLKSGAFVALIVVAGVMSGAGPVEAHGGDDHGAETNVVTSDVPRRNPDGTTFVPKASQRLLGLRTIVVKEQTAPEVRELIGTVVPDPSTFGNVQAPMDGQIEIAEEGIAFVGQKVKAGQVLALLAPSIPVADLGTMEQLRAEVDGRLQIAEQRLKRLTQVASVIARRDIDDTKAELQALKEQQRVLAPKGVEKIELVAPVSGVISVAEVRPGQVVSARDTLFEIVDPDKLWIEAVGSDLHAGEAIASATAVDTEDHAVPLSYVGRSPTLRQQSRPYLFRIDEPHQGLAIGAQIEVLAASNEEIKGIILPAQAVVRASNGLQQVWVKEAPEVFRPIPVRERPLDGERTLVTSGLKPGMRAVTIGAELVNQVR